MQLLCVLYGLLATSAWAISTQHGALQETVCGAQKAQIAQLKSDILHPVYFCEWYLSSTRSRTPIPSIQPSQLAQTCQCLLKKQPVALSSKSIAGMDQVPAFDEVKCNRQHAATVRDEFRLAYAFCKFEAAIGRSTSPIRGFSALKVKQGCKCIINARSSTIASTSKPGLPRSSGSSAVRSPTSLGTTSRRATSTYTTTPTKKVTSTSSVSSQKSFITIETTSISSEDSSDATTTVSSSPIHDTTVELTSSSTTATTTTTTATTTFATTSTTTTATTTTTTSTTTTTIPSSTTTVPITTAAPSSTGHTTICDIIATHYTPDTDCDDDFTMYDNTTAIYRTGSATTSFTSMAAQDAMNGCKDWMIDQARGSQGGNYPDANLYWDYSNSTWSCVWFGGDVPGAFDDEDVGCSYTIKATRYMNCG
ncbi:hypothetical protein K461DRAFT_324533 [Myriangium duriaei CBS 260.36]|uniref:Uncharacterized protein n=1 Tax=Myriangium duriaei CBS 260.36 TaxID=1168546 RepID=A0A9P4IV94_9PEZI|nr:hypothetical protein K461DRAFT_324533 [Myriangium duriaei CBS 260.36]